MKKKRSRIAALGMIILFVGCSRHESRPIVPDLGSKWTRITAAECEGKELGKDADSLRSALINSIGPIETKKRELDQTHGVGPFFKLIDSTYFRGYIAGEQVVFAVGDFYDARASHAFESGTQTRLLLWRGLISVLEVAERTSGLAPTDPLALWVFGRTLRIVVRDYNTHGSKTIVDSLTIWDYDLGKNNFTKLAGIGDSEHYYEFAPKMEMSTATGKMVITLIDPHDGEDTDAEADAYSDDPRVEIEQLRRTCVRVTLPNPS